MAKPIQVLTEKQCSEYLEYLKPNSPGRQGLRKAHRNYTMALIMLDAGLRVGEVSRLTKSNVMFGDEFLNNIVLTKSITKTKTERTIPMTSRLQEALKVMNDLYWQPNKCQPDNFAFYGHVNIQRLSVRQIQRMINQSSFDALGFAINPHALRHTFATRLMSNTNIRIVQELLGHASIQSTQIYTHPNNVDLKTAIDSLNPTPKNPN
ncbi:unnamed protein product, partial [marine sediment metagenome]